MNYHKIDTDNMLNGSGLRVVLYLSGCNHYCKGCHNPQTHDENSGFKFDISAKEEIFKELSKDYIQGLTLTGGDPLHENNINDVLNLINEVRLLYPKKTIWIYTGYTVDYIDSTYGFILNPSSRYEVLYLADYKIIEMSKHDQIRGTILSKCDVLVDGRYIHDLNDINYPWAGSTNQRVIDVQKSLKNGEIILW